MTHVFHQVQNLLLLNSCIEKFIGYIICRSILIFATKSISICYGS